MSRKHLSANNLAIYGGVVLGVLGGVHYLIHKNIKVPVKADDVQKLSDMNVPHETIIDIQNSNKSNKKSESAIDHGDIATPVNPIDQTRRTSTGDKDPVDAIDTKYKFAMNNQDVKSVDPPPSPTDDFDLSNLQRRIDELDTKVDDPVNPAVLAIEKEKAEMLRKAAKKKKKVKTPEVPEKMKTASGVQKFLAENRGKARVVGGRRTKTPTKR